MALVVVFSFQLSRFYLAVSTCSHHTRDGYALQHCKDVLSGLGVNRGQPGGITAAVSHPTLEATWVNLPTQADPTHDIPLPPPFHPPRSLS